MAEVGNRFLGELVPWSTPAMRMHALVKWKMARSTQSCHVSLRSEVAKAPLSEAIKRQVDQQLKGWKNMEKLICGRFTDSASSQNSSGPMVGGSEGRGFVWP